ncbi:MAG: hypothetical protein HRT44_07140 [Bdellovibrionales bacterium]|nr:hypothetical protein [Bdellovibrionales bacterium]NQZ19011.1 hypothetical protein [Bdellovibrionales bacterium]
MFLKNLCLSLVSIMLLPLTASADLSYRTFQELLVDHEVAIKTPRLRLERNNSSGFFRGVGISAGYAVRFANHPNDPDLYYRKEILDASVTLRAALGDNLNLSFGPSVRAEFVRPFPIDKLLKVERGAERGWYSNDLPYRPNQAPHTWEKALNLKQNEYYEFTGKLGLQVSSSQLTQSGFLSVTPYANYFIHGDFKLLVYRLSGSRVRVEAFVLNQRGINIGVGSSYRPDVQIFQVGALDNLVESALKLTPLRYEALGWSTCSQVKITFDYDLSQPAAQRAFDQVMDISDYELREYAVLLNVNDPDNTQKVELLSSRIDLSTSGAFVDGNGIDRDSVSAANFTSVTNAFGLNLYLSHREVRSTFADIDYRISKGNDPTMKYYKIASLTLQERLRILRDWKENQVIKDGNIIFTKNADGAITALNEMSCLYQRTDVKLKQSDDCTGFCPGTQIFGDYERVRVLGQLRKMIPPSLFNEQEFYDVLTARLGKRTYIEVKTTLSQEAVLLLQSMSDEDINEVIDSYFYELAVAAGDYHNRGKFHFGKTMFGSTMDQMYPRSNDDGPTEEELRNQVRISTERLKEVFHPILTTATTSQELLDQWEGMKDARRVRHFRENLSGLVVRLLEKAGANNSSRYFRIEVNIKAQDMADYPKSYGRYEPSEESRAILHDKNRILNRNFNPEYFNE